MRIMCAIVCYHSIIQISMEQNDFDNFQDIYNSPWILSPIIVAAQVMMNNLVVSEEEENIPMEVLVEGQPISPGQKDSSENNENIPLRTQQQRKRSSNNIFKTPLSQFRKCIIEILRTNNFDARNEIRHQLNQIYKVKNYGVFPKLLFITRQLSIFSKVKKLWEVKSIRLIQRKQKLFLKNSYTQERFENLKKVIVLMNKALQEQNIVESFDTYWGQYRHSEKYQMSKRQFLNFVDQFSSFFHKNSSVKEFSQKRETTMSKKGKRNKFSRQEKKNE